MSYKEGDSRKRGVSLGRDEMPLVAQLTARVRTWLFEQAGAADGMTQGRSAANASLARDPPAPPGLTAGLLAGRWMHLILPPAGPGPRIDLLPNATGVILLLIELRRA